MSNVGNISNMSNEGNIAGKGNRGYMSNLTGPSEAGRLGRLKPPHFFTTFHKL